MFESSYMFFSFSKADSDMVREFIEDLSAKRYHIWFDPGMENGIEWPVVAERIECCTLFVAFVSKNYNSSPTALGEYKYALCMQKNVLIIRLDDGYLPNVGNVGSSQNKMISIRDFSTKNAFYDELFRNPRFSECSDFFRVKPIERVMALPIDNEIHKSSDIITIQIDSSKASKIQKQIDKKDIADYIAFLNSVASAVYEIPFGIPDTKGYYHDLDCQGVENVPKSVYLDENWIRFYSEKNEFVHKISYDDFINRTVYNWTDDVNIFNDYHSISLADLKKDYMMATIYSDLTEIAEDRFELKKLKYDLTVNLPKYKAQAFPEYFRRLKKYFKEPLYKKEHIFRGMELPSDVNLYYAYDHSLTINGTEGFALTDIGIYCRCMLDKNVYYTSFDELKKGGPLVRRDRSTFVLGNGNKPIACCHGVDAAPIKRIFDDLKRFV